MITNREFSALAENSKQLICKMSCLHPESGIAARLSLTESAEDAE